jgi:ABC-type transport system substrate-binding protein
MGMIPTEFGSDIIGLGKVVYIGIQNGGEWYQYNPQRAKQLLTEAGYPDGFKTAVTFSGSSVLSSDVPVIIQDMWKRNLGVQLDIKNVDAATISTTAREKSWDGLISNWTAGTWSDGTSGFLTKLKGEAFNIQNIDDPTFGQLFEQARRELDPAKRAALIWQAEQRELDQVYMFRLNHLWVYDVRQPWDLNNAGHLWEAPGFWMAMIDPDKMKK